MTNKITLQRISQLSTIPSDRLMRKWINTIISKRRKEADITLRIVNKSESASLNQNYRNKQGATNILSFAYESDPLCGDIVLCAPLIAEQAKIQNKSIESHWAHLIVHGTLHLLGYDHQTKKQATVMEKLEIEILRTLGFNNPY